MKSSILISIFFVLFLSNCGRKQKNIFDFPDPNKIAEPKVSKLSLPAVKGVKVEKTLQGNKISWRAVLDKKYLFDFGLKLEVSLIGYNVYRLVNSVFVPKKTVNQFWIRKTEFLDIQVLEPDVAEQSQSYLVRAVFKINDKEIEGPASCLVSV